ncbi:MAG: ribonuclease P protein component [Deltaproteobacteria bacterium]|nr:ribonuclease P protein component [Deltaproteobacteria bacterium]
MKKFGFPKALRVTRTGDFARIQGRGRRIHGRRVTLAFDRNRRGETRVGITVSAKQANSPERNRFKRLVREVFRRTRRAWPVGFDYVVIAKEPKAIRSYDDMEIELAGVVRRVDAR